MTFWRNVSQYSSSSKEISQLHTSSVLHVTSFFLLFSCDWQKTSNRRKMSLDHRRPKLTLRVRNVQLKIYCCGYSQTYFCWKWFPNRSIQVSVACLSINTITPTWFSRVSVGFFCSISLTLTPPDWSSSPVKIQIFKKTVISSLHLALGPLDTGLCSFQKMWRIANEFSKETSIQNRQCIFCTSLSHRQYRRTVEELKECLESVTYD